MSPEKPIRGQPDFTKDTAPIAVSLRAITDRKARGRLRAASTIDAIKTSLTRWVDNEGWTYEFENQPRVTIAEKDIERAASTVDLKVWDASNTLIFRDRIHAWDGFPVLVPDGTQRQEISDIGEIILLDNLKEDPVEATKTDLAHTVRVVTKDGKSPWVKAKPGTVSTFYSTNVTQVRSSDATYATARAGASLVTQSAGDGAQVGQLSSGGWYIWERFEDFDTSAIDDTDEVSAAVLSFYMKSDQSFTDFTLQARLFDWGTSVTTADWIAGASLGSQTLLATLSTNGWTGRADFTDVAFPANVNLTGVTRLIINSSLHIDGTETSSYIQYYNANATGTTQDPKLVVTHAATTNTAPTITAGPTTTYASGTCTTPTVTWGVTFTATDSEQTGADALTYYIRTSSTFGAGTQVATGTCTSGVSKAVTGLAYNAPGVVEGTQTLYLHIYDGALNTVTASSFILVRRFIRSTAGTGGTLSGVLSRAPIYGKAITGAISSISGALSRVTGKALAGSTGATTGALNAIKTYFKQVTGAISSATGAIVKRTNKTLTGSPTSIYASTTKTVLRLLNGTSGSVSAALTFTKKQSISLSGSTASITGSLLANTTYARAIAGELLSLTGAISRSTLKALSGTSGTLSGSLVADFIAGGIEYLQSVSGTIGTLTGSLAKVTSRSLTGVVGAFAGELSRMVNKALSGSPASLSASLTRATMKSISGVSGVLSGALSAGKTTALALAGGISALSGSLTYGVTYTKAIAGELLSITGNVSRMTLKALSGSSGAVSGVLSFTRLFFKAIAGELLSLMGNVSRITFKGLSGSSGAVLGALSSTLFTKLYTKAIAGEIATISGGITRFVTKSFSGTITGSGILSTAASFYRTVTGSLSSLSGSFSFRSIIRRVKMKGGSVVRSVISGGSRILR